MSIDWTAVEAEVVGHLQALLRLDTTNPPGNETAAAAYIARACAEAGIAAEIVESAPGRGNVVARLKAAHPQARPLMLMGHTDVVSVERDKWSRDPFSGDLVEGELWGRGALDMKGQVAANLTALLLLKRQGIALNRDIILAAFADEEAGGEFGAAWMWQHRRELIDAEYAINEGGGTPVNVGGHRFYLCQTGEKGVSRLRLITQGQPGHASVPLDDTAMKRLGETLTAIHTWQPPTTITPTVRAMLETIGRRLDAAAQAQIAAIFANPSWEALAKLPVDADLRNDLRAMTRNTIVPTIVHGGHRLNVIPSEIVLDADGRILPGEDPETWRQSVQEVVGGNAEVSLLSRNSGIEADPASPLFDAIAATIQSLDPEAAVAPYLCTGGTDARHLPGVKVYGFFPILPTRRVAEYTPLIHGHDERIAVADLLYGTRFLYKLVGRFAAQ